MNGQQQNEAAGIPIIPREAIVFEEDEKRKAMFPPDFEEYWAVIEKKLYQDLDKRFMQKGNKTPAMALAGAAQVAQMKAAAAHAWFVCKQVCEEKATQKKKD